MNLETQMRSEAVFLMLNGLMLARNITTLASIRAVLSQLKIRLTTWADKTAQICSGCQLLKRTVETFDLWLSLSKTLDASLMPKRIPLPLFKQQWSPTSKSNAISQWVAHQATKRVHRVTAERQTNRFSDGYSQKFNETNYIYYR